MSLASVMSHDHFIYRAFDAAGRLLYVGCSMHVPQRLREHKVAHAGWVPLVQKVAVEGPYSYSVARSIEREAIRTEGPSHSGQTPAALSRRRTRAKFVEDFIAVAMSHGETFSDATRQAVLAADIELDEDAA